VKVSVLIHNINRASVLAPCLESVATQSHRPLEVVVLDAGSTDGSDEVIRRAGERMRAAGIELRAHQCELLGVAASRNLAARNASGELLWFLDNDATLSAPDAVAEAVRVLGAEPEVVLLAFRILRGDSSEIDPLCWVYRRSSRRWNARPFRTFTFPGGGFCVRSSSFWRAGGFWEHLRYAREEEDLALALIQRGETLLYWPAVTIRHYPDPRGRAGMAERRFTELRNGIEVLWRRFPAPLALAAIAGRITSMSLRAALNGQASIGHLSRAVHAAIDDWRSSGQSRRTVSTCSVLQYLSLHLSGPWSSWSHAASIRAD
jgi:glycosyltransferase involved in cell wall biosynthesis